MDWRRSLIKFRTAPMCSHSMWYLWLYSMSHALLACCSIKVPFLFSVKGRRLGWRWWKGWANLRFEPMSVLWGNNINHFVSCLDHYCTQTFFLGLVGIVSFLFYFFGPLAPFNHKKKEPFVFLIVKLAFCTSVLIQVKAQWSNQFLHSTCHTIMRSLNHA